MTPCPHGMPTKASCVDCMDEGPVAPPVRWRQIGEPFTSGYPGDCVGATCDRPIVVGDRIQRWDRGDQRTKYAHEGCKP